MARRAASVAHAEDASQFVQGESDSERASHKTHSIEVAGRIFAITVSRTARPREQALALVMPQCVSAHTGEPRQFS
jgi:hypothetical protein